MHPGLTQYRHLAPQFGGGMHDTRFGAPPSGAMQTAMDASGFTFNGGWSSMDAAVAGGMVFLESELELRDPTLYEPLTSVTWFRDITANSGGGWVDYTSNFFIRYGISGPNQYGFVSNSTSQITAIQADISKEQYPVSNWSNEAIVSYVDMQKSQRVGRALDAIYEDGIRLNWAKSLDLTTYAGWGTNAGLLNNANVTRVSAPNGGSGTTWASKTVAQQMADMQQGLVSIWTNANYDPSVLEDVTVLMPPAQWASITSAINSTAGSVSLLTYFLQNNLATKQGGNLRVLPSRWCIGAGSGSTDRMLFYTNTKSKVVLDIPVPVQRIMTQTSVERGGAYLTLFMGQVGVVKFRYYQNVLYMDGI